MRVDAIRNTIFDRFLANPLSFTVKALKNNTFLFLKRKMYRSNLISHTLKNVLSNIGFIRTTANTSRNFIYKDNFFVKPLQLRMTEKYRRYGNNRSQETKRSYLLAMFLPTLIHKYFFDDEPDDEVSKIVVVLKRSILLIQQEKFDKAEQMLHIALHQAQTIQHYDAITYIYDVLANLAFYTQEYHKAQKLFVIVMQRLMSKGALENDMRVIHISLKVAKVMEALGQLDEAELGYKFCMEHLQSHIETDPENMEALHAQMLTYGWYGQMLVSKHRNTEAYNFILRALDMVEKADASHEDTIDMLNNLGYICYVQEKYDEAIKYYSAAVEIGKKVPDMPYMDIIHVNIGNVFLKKGLYKEAKNSCQEGRKIANKVNNNDVMQEADECLKEVKKLLLL